MSCCFSATRLHLLRVLLTLLLLFGPILPLDRPPHRQRPLRPVLLKSLRPLGRRLPNLIPNLQVSPLLQQPRHRLFVSLLRSRMQRRALPRRSVRL